MSSASQSDCPIARSFVLDGDGSLLMNLGSLVTIAGVAPANLTHFVCQSGCYEANGDHPIPGQDRVSFAGFARAAGYRVVTEFSNLDMCTELPAFAASARAILRGVACQSW